MSCSVADTTVTHPSIHWPSRQLRLCASGSLQLKIVSYTDGIPSIFLQTISRSLMQVVKLIPPRREIALPWKGLSRNAQQENLPQHE
jgi:hypothetical protein